MKWLISFFIVILQIVAITSVATIDELRTNKNITTITNNNQHNTLNSSDPIQDEVINSIEDIDDVDDSDVDNDNGNSTEKLVHNTHTDQTTFSPVNQAINGNGTINVELSRFLQDNPNVNIIQTPGYPNPYEAGYNRNWSINVIDIGTSIGIDVTIHDLDINSLSDFLYISSEGIIDSSASNNTKAIKLSRAYSMPLNLRFSNTSKLYVCFHSDNNLYKEKRGFLLTYGPTGNAKLNRNITNLSTILSDNNRDLEATTILINVPLVQQNLETWHSFKYFLVNASNKYIQEHRIPLEVATTNNVTMVIQKCSSNWPDSTNCLNILFAIALNYIEASTANGTYQLSTDHLDNMWNEFGRNEFAKFGIQEYSLPDTTFIILLWTGVTAGITFLFLFILYSIWRMEIFQEYRRMSNAHDDHRNILKQNKPDMDYSSDPSSASHQIVPQLFPNNAEEYATAAGMEYNNRVMELSDLRGKHNPYFQDDEVTFSNLDMPSPRNNRKFNIKGMNNNSSTT